MKSNFVEFRRVGSLPLGVWDRVTLAAKLLPTGCSGVGVICSLSEYPTIRGLWTFPVMCVYHENTRVSEIMHAHHSGVIGFIGADTTDQDLLETLTKLHTAAVRTEQQRVASQKLSWLTPRQTQALMLWVVGGNEYKHAVQLGVKVKTVTEFRRRIRDRLQLRSIAAIIHLWHVASNRVTY